MKIIRVRACRECPYIEYGKECGVCSIKYPPISVYEYAKRNSIHPQCPLEDEK